MAGQKRAIRIANCSGAAGDPGQHMYNQAKYGDVDVVTGDYLAEANIASNADQYRKGTNPGWMPTAWDGIQKTVELANEKRIKIIINGGALNPKGLAEKTHELIQEKKLNLRVAWVEGDDLYPRVETILEDITAGKYAHLDARNSEVKLVKDTDTFLQERNEKPVVSANAYLGYRAIKRGLDEGADIIICGRVWGETDYDELAGTLIAGHLIECSTYVTGANFAGFYKYDIKDLLNLGLPIAEVFANGETVITKHEALPGIVTADTVKCQLLYELQGNIYLNSDVKADITNIRVVDEAKNRVHVSGVKGYPPPPTTKLAIFYIGGYQCEMTLNATGYATSKKYDLQEAQIKSTLEQWGVLKDIDLDFQRVGVPKDNPDSQLSSTTYLRMFAQAKDAQTVGRVPAAWMWNSMQHYAGMHCTLDMRSAIPIPFLGFYPITFPQSELDEAVNLLGSNSASYIQRFAVGPPKKTEPLAPREDYETKNPAVLEDFGPTETRSIGDLVLARSGDKGANVNLGLYVHTTEQWEWLRSFLTKDRLKKLMGKDWKDWYFIERVEFPDIYAVHFVIYGPLGRGVSSSKLLDSLGKGFGEFIRAVHVPIPKKFLE